jgi:hypothetical protein
LIVLIKYFLALDLPTIENVVPGAVRHPSSPETQI